MGDLYPEISPYESGMLDVGDGNVVYWETCGNPNGKPAVVLHGGPGSGCGEWFRRFFDPDAYRVVLFDQRNCGRSTPHASEPTTDLTTNTTAHLVGDIESLRNHLDIGRWLVLGGSWGSTLGLAYAEEHPARVSELILFGVTTGRHSEWDWGFRGGLALFFPEQWEQLEAAVSAGRGAGDIVETYHRLLSDEDVAVRAQAAEAWCLWESATPDWPPKTGLAERFRDPRYAVAFARIVTHFARHYAWLEDGVLLRNATALADTPGVLVNGRFDFQAPIANAWKLKEAWPRAELVIVDDAGHGTGLDSAIVRATRQFAAQR
jgi:proline iminopeptidase